MNLYKLLSLSQKILICFILFISSSNSYFSLHAESADSSEGIHRTFRHIIILQADLENIWGNYYFAVTNNTGKPLAFKSPVMLPNESVDFRAQEGLKEEDLKIDSEGQLYVDKVFSPGLNLMGIGFQIKTSAIGSDNITFSPSFDIEELSIAVPKAFPLHLEGEGFISGVPPMLANGQYSGIQSEKRIETTQQIKIKLSGIPKDRFKFWILGAVVALSFLLIAVFFTYYTHASPSESHSSKNDDAYI